MGAERNSFDNEWQSSSDMRLSVWAILMITAASFGLLLFWPIVNGFDAWFHHYWQDGFFIIYILPPLCVGVLGLAFLLLRRESLQTTDEPIWVALIMYAAIGASIALQLRDQFGIGVT